MCDLNRAVSWDGCHTEPAWCSLCLFGLGFLFVCVFVCFVLGVVVVVVLL